MSTRRKDAAEREKARIAEREATQNRIREFLESAGSAGPEEDAVDEVIRTFQPNPSIGTPRRRPIPRLGKAMFRTLSQIELKERKWLWPGRISIGEPALFYGDCDQGKSMLMIAIAAIITTGGCWPDLAGECCEKGDVLFIQDEVTPENTIKERVQASGGDPDRIHFLDNIIFAGDDDFSEPDEHEFNLRAHLKELEIGLSAFPETRLIVIDPVTAFLGGADENSTGDVRAMLRPLSRMGRRLGVSIVMINHVNKGSGTKAIYRALGTGAFVNVMRAAFFVGTDPDDTDRRIIASAKFNLGPKPDGIAYRFDGDAIRFEPKSIPGMTADRMLARERQVMLREEADGKRGPLPMRKREAMGAVEAALADGAVETSKLLGELLKKFPRTTLTSAMQSLRELGKTEDFAGPDGVPWTRKKVATERAQTADPKTSSAKRGKAKP
jgi:putative DNA primase/helicase